MKPHVTCQRLLKTLIATTKSPVIYLQNPKVCSSSVRAALWRKASPRTFAGKPHTDVGAPFVGLPYLSDVIAKSQFFTIVRNPYARLLSAYLNKVASSRRDMPVWVPIKYRFKFDTIPSFREFIAAIARERGDLLDPHFAPQYCTVLSHAVTPDHVFHFEKLDEAVEWLASRKLRLDNHAPHKTSAANQLLEYYGEAEIDIVKALYARDFEFFGYSTDIEISAPIRDISVPKVDRAVISNLLRMCVEPARAVKIEARDALIDADIDARTIALDFANTGDMLEAARNMAGETNWRYLSALGEHLSSRQMVRQAAMVMATAASVMDDDIGA